MKRSIVCLAVLVGLAAPALADTWSVGYGVVPMTYDFVINDLAAKGVDTQGQDKLSLGVLNVMYEHDRKVSDSIHLVLTTGLGFPIGTGKHDPTKENINPAAGASNNWPLNTGDSLEWSVVTVPVLIGAKYSMPMGDNALSVGVSVGGLLVGLQQKEIDKNWTGSPEASDWTNTSYENYVRATYEILANLGYHIRQGEGSAISISAVVGVVSEARMDSETVLVSPTATQMATYKAGKKIGGMTFGVNVGWSKSF